VITWKVTKLEELGIGAGRRKQRYEEILTISWPDFYKLRILEIFSS
jgi:hypothetical protein